MAPHVNCRAAFSGGQNVIPGNTRKLLKLKLEKHRVKLNFWVFNFIKRFMLQQIFPFRHYNFLSSYQTNIGNQELTVKICCLFKKTMGKNIFLRFGYSIIYVPFFQVGIHSVGMTYQWKKAKPM